ncbi:right-handed parallel beta-helix repeat-containing protein [Methanoplanus endosymbiosus]|uniref:Probable pectate lyase C n=1 Tax=Methanoplanus endosymbiosus TaxID=33865 RepID=A0A9E7TKU5_9EURY|nr:right-handed parallel beta-helix repeat-containing protein [Methanoplanus endosymbiosus]UUX93104.1 right-handed parallel beta-helix repeat-containing protein [Methanoplanus endosymbiosus]
MFWGKNKIALISLMLLISSLILCGAAAAEDLQISSGSETESDNRNNYSVSENSSLLNNENNSYPVNNENNSYPVNNENNYSVSVPAVLPEQVNAEEDTGTDVPDVYPNISAAIDAANPGDTITVGSGTYNEIIEINKPLTIKGVDTGGGLPVISGGGMSSALAVVSINCNNSVIDNFHVRDYEGSHWYGSGIFLNASHCSILNSTISDSVNGRGIYSGYINYYKEITNSTISGNIIHSNNKGIYLDRGCSNIKITSNEIRNNTYGFRSYNNPHLFLRNNSLHDNSYNLILFDYTGDGDIDTSNLVDGKPVYYLSGESGRTIDSSTNAGMVILVKCEDITVSGLDLSNCGTGIFIAGCNNCKISGNTIKYSEYGIENTGSNGSTISDNQMIDGWCGIIIDGSTDVTLRRNEASGNNFNYAMWSFAGNDIDQTNTADKKPVLYYDGETSLEITSEDNPGAVFLTGCSDIYIHNIEISNEDAGVHIEESTGVRTENCNFSDIYSAVILDESEECSLKYSDVEDCHILAELYNSNNNSVNKNEGRNCNELAYISSGRYNSIKRNNISSAYSGLYLTNSDYNLISRNTISTGGIYLNTYNSVNNSVYLNDFITGIYYNDNLNDGFDGIQSSVSRYYLHKPELNSETEHDYYRNYDNTGPYTGYGSIITNEIPDGTVIIDESYSKNLWNSTYLTYQYEEKTYSGYMGNFWTSYSGTDTDGNGIGNTEHYIGYEEYDHYPLIKTHDNYIICSEQNNADFTANPLFGAKPLEVTFTDRSVGDPYEWSWDFGDGSNSTKKNPVHTYTQTGTFSVSLNITNSTGTYSAAKYDYIKVTDPLVVPDNYPTISAAISAAENGDTIQVKSGEYNEIVTINKTLILTGIDTGSGLPVINGEGLSDANSLVSLDCNNSVIENFVIQNFKGDYWASSGIYMNASYCSVLNNTICDLNYGIYSSYIGYYKERFNNTISGNTISSNNEGIYLDRGCSNIKITSNEIRNNTYGLESYDNSYLFLRNNSLHDNSYNLILFDYTGDSDIDTGNLVDGKPVYYLSGESGRTIDSSTNAGMVCLVNCSDITVSDLDLSNCGVGIWISGCNNCTISGNTIKYSEYGIENTGSNGSTISDNQISNGGWCGIIIDGSTDVTLRRNEASGNNYNYAMWSFAGNDIDQTNTADKKPVLYYDGETSLEITSEDNPGAVFLTGCSDIYIHDIEISNEDAGVHIEESIGVRTENCNFSDIYSAVILDKSEECSFKYSDVEDCHILAELYNSNNNSVNKNEGRNCDVPAYISSGRYNSIKRNNISSDYSYLYISDSDYNLISRNTISTGGIYLYTYNSVNNSVYLNDFITGINYNDNLNDGFDGIQSSVSRYYLHKPELNSETEHDNYRNYDNTGPYTGYDSIITNEIPDGTVIIDESYSKNLWNSPTKLTYQYREGNYSGYMGNFWTSYSGTDTDGNGIGNTEHYIGYEEYDHYPLINTTDNYILYSVKGDFNGNGFVDIGDVSRVAYMVAGLTPVDMAADFNGNGKVDIGDAAMIAWYFVGKTAEL